MIFFNIWAKTFSFKVPIGSLHVWDNLKISSQDFPEKKKNQKKSPDRASSLENSSIFIAKYFFTEYNWKNINRGGMDSKANIRTPRAEMYKHQ